MKLGRAIPYVLFAAAAGLVVAVQRDTVVRRWLAAEPPGRATLRAVLPEVRTDPATFADAAAAAGRPAGVPVTLDRDAQQIVERDAPRYALRLTPGVPLGDALAGLIAQANAHRDHPLIVDASGGGGVVIRTLRPQSWPVPSRVVRAYDVQDLLPPPGPPVGDGPSARARVKSELQALADTIIRERHYAGLGGWVDPTPYRWVGGRMVVLAREVGHRQWAEALRSMRATGQRPFRPTW